MFDNPTPNKPTFDYATGFNQGIINWAGRVFCYIILLDNPISY